MGLTLAVQSGQKEAAGEGRLYVPDTLGRQHVFTCPICHHIQCTCRSPDPFNHTSSYLLLDCGFSDIPSTSKCDRNRNKSLCPNRASTALFSPIRRHQTATRILSCCVARKGCIGPSKRKAHVLVGRLSLIHSGHDPRESNSNNIPLQGRRAGLGTSWYIAIDKSVPVVQKWLNDDTDIDIWPPNNSFRMNFQVCLVLRAAPRL